MRMSWGKSIEVEGREMSVKALRMLGSWVSCLFLSGF